MTLRIGNPTEKNPGWSDAQVGHVLTCLLDPCFEGQVEKFGVVVFEAEFGENGAHNLLASGVVVYGEGLVLGVCAQHAREDLDYHLSGECN